MKGSKAHALGSPRQQLVQGTVQSSASARGASFGSVSGPIPAAFTAPRALLRTWRWAFMSPGSTNFSGSCPHGLGCSFCAVFPNINWKFQLKHSFSDQKAYCGILLEWFSASGGKELEQARIRCRESHLSASCYPELARIVTSTPKRTHFSVKGHTLSFAHQKVSSVTLQEQSDNMRVLLKVHGK